MIFRQKNVRTYQTPILISLTVICLFGCGGGGGDNSAPVANEVPIITTTVTEESTTEPEQAAVVDYSPDPVKLSDTAAASRDLYVEPMFNFDSFKRVSFDISAIDNLKQPLSDVMLSISVIDEEITALDDPLLQQKSLLSKVFTDSNGQIYITLEMALSVNKVLLELNTLGLENDVIFRVDETGVVSHSFEQN